MYPPLPVGTIPVVVIPYLIAYSVNDKEEATWVVLRIILNCSQGMQGMWAEQLQAWNQVETW